MAKRISTVLLVALPLLAAGAAPAAEADPGAGPDFVTGLAAEQFAAPGLARDEATIAAEPAAPALAKLDLQPLRARLGGAAVGGGEPSADPGETGAAARMLELYYDVAADAAWRPYVGAGVGVANARPSELNCMTLCSSLADADRAIGYQFMAGVTWELKKDVVFFAEHRLTGLARGALIDNDGARSEFEGLRDRAFGGGVRIGF